MARAIEDAMVSSGVIKPEDDTPDAAEIRRRALVAIATGVVTHLKGNIEIIVRVNKLSSTVPSSETTLFGSSGDVR